MLYRKLEMQVQRSENRDLGVLCRMNVIWRMSDFRVWGDTHCWDWRKDRNQQMNQKEP